MANKTHTKRLTALRAAREQLKTVIVDCAMALDGRWDRSDDGFEAIKDACTHTLHTVRAAIKG